jgi:hypothetical protein
MKVQGLLKMWVARRRYYKVKKAVKKIEKAVKRYITAKRQLKIKKEQQDA